MAYKCYETRNILGGNQVQRSLRRETFRIHAFQLQNSDVGQLNATFLFTGGKHLPKASSISSRDVANLDANLQDKVRTFRPKTTDKDLPRRLEPNNDPQFASTTQHLVTQRICCPRDLGSKC